MSLPRQSRRKIDKCGQRGSFSLLGNTASSCPSVGEYQCVAGNMIKLSQTSETPGIWVPQSEVSERRQPAKNTVDRGSPDLTSSMLNVPLPKEVGNPWAISEQSFILLSFLFFWLGQTWELSGVQPSGKSHQLGSIFNTRAPGFEDTIRP